MQIIGVIEPSMHRNRTITSSKHRNMSKISNYSILMIKMRHAPRKTLLSGTMIPLRTSPSENSHQALFPQTTYLVTQWHFLNMSPFNGALEVTPLIT